MQPQLTKVQARSRVAIAVKYGRLPAAKTQTCVDCGGPARQYDHYLGYTVEHALSVQPVCIACHERRSQARGEHYGPARPHPNHVDACVVCGRVVEGRKPYRHGRCPRCRLHFRKYGTERPVRPEHGNAKLTDEDVRTIRASTEMNVVLARRFRVSAALVSLVRRGKTR
jgi:hypothetical protein